MYRAFAGLISLEPTPPLRSSTELITHGEREENLHLPREREDNGGCLNDGWGNVFGLPY